MGVGVSVGIGTSVGTEVSVGISVGGKTSTDEAHPTSKTLIRMIEVTSIGGRIFPPSRGHQIKARPRLKSGMKINGVLSQYTVGWL